ncbi:unnamed protein product [Didymodactylos carnosus]|uniref:Uncharacterized protein n=1 Tax=Didymodactylos carnosus TaxID=1234261 RepID=A0A8S2EE24_9BILA|nr:unnamed protein product [Didymodactylos carnosus]CAF3928397.1 unnamed protein product [Didymodactylos carnosus]
MGDTQGVMEINLSKYPDFSIETHPAIGNEECCSKNGQIYTIIVQPKETVKAALVLVPAEIAFYDFMLPIRTCPPLVGVEGLSQSSKPSSSIRQERRILSASEQQALQPSRPLIRRHVRATALSECLQVSTKELHFTLYGDQFQAMKQGGYCDCQEILLINNSKKKVSWLLDLRNNVTLDNDVFRILHSTLIPFISSPNTPGPEGELDRKEVFAFKVNFVPPVPGIYVTRIPLYINNNFDTPYTMINLYGEVVMPTLVFEPRRVILSPVPLDIESNACVRIKPKGFEKSTQLSVIQPEKSQQDALYELSTSFVDQPFINPDELQDIVLKVFFTSSKSISETVILKLTDNEKNIFELEVCVTADNSMFTCYSFLWKSESEYHIVVQPGQIMKGSRIKSDESHKSGEPLLVQKRAISSSNSRPNTSTSATFDQANESEDTSSENNSPQNRNERTPTPFARVRSGASSVGENNQNELNAALLPYFDNDTKTFHWLVSILERWFSNQGWPKGTYPVKIPTTFRWYAAGLQMSLASKQK